MALSRVFNLPATVLLTCVLCLQFSQLKAEVQNAAKRQNAFIGYHEKAKACEDQLPDCAGRSLNNGCIYDTYTMRRFCPASCNVEHCTSRGTIKIRHKGHATSNGTSAYQAMMAKQYNLPKSHMKILRLGSSGEQLYLSSLGTGTYLGEADAKTDEAVMSAVVYSVTHGWNVLDTASNYRWGRAEAVVGLALDALLTGDVATDFRAGDQSSGNVAVLNGDITRDMLFISTKAGFTSPDLVQRLQQSGDVTPEDVVGGMHCIHPAYLKASLEQSLQRMNLETVDLLYLHNVFDVQLPHVGQEELARRLREAFKFCERARREGKIQFYGLATWDAPFRVDPNGEQQGLYMPLADILAIAAEVGGSQHGLRFLQLPVSVDMIEAWTEPWQPLGGRNVTLMEAARALGVAVQASGPLGEAQLLQQYKGRLDGLLSLSPHRATAGKLLQLVRSTPGLVTTLVGHKARENVEENIKVAHHPLLPRAELQDVLMRIWSAPWHVAMDRSAAAAKLGRRAAAGGSKQQAAWEEEQRVKQQRRLERIAAALAPEGQQGVLSAREHDEH